MPTFERFHKSLSLFRIIIACFFLLPGLLAAQQPNDPFPGENYNHKYLEHLIKVKVDSVRETKGLYPLANDALLYYTSRDHALYLREEKKLSHYNTDDDSLKTPQLRAECKGAVNYLTGENLARTYVGRTMREGKREYVNTTYADIANDLVNGWVNSPDHYANIITPRFEVTGVAVEYDPEKKEIKAVQMFAEVKFQYDFTEDTELFPYSEWTNKPVITSFDQVSGERLQDKYEWGLKPPRDSLEFCRECNLAIDTAWYQDELTPKGRRIEFYTPNVEMMASILGNWRNGLALEVVTYDPYDCGNPAYYTMPSRRNGQSLLNGEVLEPMYRRHLKKYFKGATFREVKKGRHDPDAYFKVKLGSLPRDLSGFVEVNLLIIRKKRVCRVMHLTGLCGLSLQELHHVPYLTRLNDYSYDARNVIRTIGFDIPFEQGRSSYDYNDIKPLLDSLHYTDFEILSASVKAYTSVEGDPSLNERIGKERASSILKAIQSGQQEPFELEVESEENWDLFRQQIEGDSLLTDYDSLSMAEVKARLTERDELSRLEPYLQEQRTARVELTMRISVSEKNLGSFLLGEFHRLKDSIDLGIRRDGVMSQLSKARIDTMANIQGFAYEMVKEGIVDTALFDRFEIGLKADYSKIIKDYFWYSLELSEAKQGDPTWERNFFYRLNQLERKGISSYEIRFDIANYLTRTSGQGRRNTGMSKDLLPLIQSLLEHKDPEMQERAQHLLENYHVKNAFLIQEDGRRGDKQSQRASLLYLMSKHAGPDADDSIQYRTAELMVYCDADDLAYELLKPVSEQADPFPPSLALFMKLGYRHIEEYGDTLYHESLINVADRMPDSTWCGMFVGPCNISFQVFDYEPLRNEYCKRCADFQNYARRTFGKEE